MLKVSSSAFKKDSEIPRRYTKEGDDVSPPLAWSGAPEKTVEFALICDDPDAPREKPWVHWVVYGIRGERSSFEEGSAGEAKEGKNDFGDTGYGGPMPPKGHGTHHYHFRVYALDTKVDLPTGATKEELLSAIQGHVLDEGMLTGTYER
jgi:Raf kinase inhibitor-like YbhB/YbcL family protein